MAPLPPIQPHNLTRWRRELRLAHPPYLTVDAPRAVPNCHTEPRHVLAVAHFVIQEYAPIEPDTYGIVWYDLVQCEEEGANSYNSIAGEVSGGKSGSTGGGPPANTPFGDSDNLPVIRR